MVCGIAAGGMCALFLALRSYRMKSAGAQQGDLLSVSVAQFASVAFVKGRHVLDYQPLTRTGANCWETLPLSAQCWIGFFITDMCSSAAREVGARRQRRRYPMIALKKRF